MTPEITALALSLVASPRWRWMNGMLAVDPTDPRDAVRIITVDGGRISGWLHGEGYGHWDVDDDGHWHDVHAGDCGPQVPYDDPATLGCLLALVREAWRDPLLNVAPSSQWGRGSEIWIVWHYDPGLPLGWREVARATTEAEALAAALLAAP